MDPMYYPRGGFSGQENGIKPSPWQLQPSMTNAQIQLPFREQRRYAEQGARLAMKTGARTLGTLPGDVIHKQSSKGLKRKICPYESVIDNTHPWHSVKIPPGHVLQRQGFKHLYNPYRQPFQRESRGVEHGGPLYTKRRARDIILQ